MDDGNGRMTVHADFVSTVLGGPRTLRVYLPPSYEAQPWRHFPVFYLHDGQNLFDGSVSFIPGVSWRLAEAADDLIRQGAIEPLIMVGIDNAGAGRVWEYTPTSVPGRGGGGADQYGRMLLDEIQPFIVQRYRVRREADATGIGGSSLGGLVSLYLALRSPEVFSRVAVLSPALGWDDGVLLREVAALPARPPLRIWLDMGTEEGDGWLRHAQRLRDLLLARGWALGDDLQYLEAQGAQHNEAAWAERAPMMLRFLFPPRPA